MSVPSGVVIDGAVYPLQGQPPIAVSQGWGNMSWLLFSSGLGVTEVHI